MRFLVDAQLPLLTWFEIWLPAVLEALKCDESLIENI